MDALHPPLFLVAAEVEVLTGFKTSAKQISWLSGKGWWPGAESNHRHADFQSSNKAN